MKILIVDDHDMNLKLLRVQLESEGQVVIEAGNGVEALEVLAREPVDGVVSDILMPRMDGYRLCLEIRHNQRLANLPVVLYTSTYNSPADRALAERAGADAYISKPAPTKTILDALRLASGRAHQVGLATTTELEHPVLKQYNETLVRKLEAKSLELEHSYASLVQVESRLSSLVETAMDGIVAVDEGQRIVLFNAAAARMFGCSREAAMGRPLDDFIPSRYRDRHAEHIQEFARTDPSSRPLGARRVVGLRADGVEMPIEASISKLETSQGQLYTVFIRDITERLRAEDRIHSLNRVYAVLSGINSLIVRARDREELFRDACRIAVEVGKFSKAWIGLIDDGDLPGRLLAWYPESDPYLAELHERFKAGAVRARGVLEPTILQQQPFVSNDIEHDPRLREQAQLVASGSRALAVFPLVVDGRVVGLLSLHSGLPGFFDHDEMKLLDELAGDISFALDHLAKSERINYLASFDALTGLPNRHLFAARLSERIKATNESGAMLAVALVDLERFRRINETLGRAGGDEVLKMVAVRLSGVDPSVARIGVDVFALEITDCNSVADIARTMQEVFARGFDQPFQLNGDELRIGSRGGVAVFPSDGSDAETLLLNAEAALRRARASAEHCVFYAAEMNARAADALKMESKLRRAIERQEFVLHYQPKLTLADGRICGVEALIRWQDPEVGLVPPMRFIPILEEAGLIGVVGKWALGQALVDQRRWRAAGFAPLRVAVNVSPLQLHQPEFAAQIGEIVEGGEGDALELEITESVIMDNVDDNIVTLNKIRGFGVSIAIDDFGTGYSSLAYIAKLPVNSLKIDRAFITGLTGGGQGITLVSSIIALAHALKLKVVAEGVETEGQAQLLRLLRCDEAQGYLYSRPVPSAEIEALLKLGRLPG